MKLSAAVTMGLCLATGLSSTLSLAEVTVEQGYFRASPPGTSNGAAFMILHNSDRAPVALISAQTPATNNAELHNHVEQDGMMKMRQVSKIEIPAMGSISLQPGGYHIMLMGLKAPLKEGNDMMLMLEFSNGHSQQLVLPIKKIQGQSMPMKTH